MAKKTSSSQQISKTNARFAEVVASPGSGKTHTLILRLRHLLATGVPADQILVLSFSNATVDEIKRRIALSAHTSAERPSRSGDVSSPQNDLSTITVRTAHSFAKSLIKKQPLLKDKEAAMLLRQAIRSLQRSCKKSAQTPHVPAATRRRRFDQLASLSADQQIARVLSLLSFAQAANSSVSEITATAQFESLRQYNEVLRAVGKKYAAIKKKQRVIDYGDMLDQGIQAIADGTPVPYTHILVDEYQDRSAAQVQLLVQLAEMEERSIMVFGDSYQGIYRFAGAGYTPLSSVLDGVKQHGMPESLRLTAETAALASAIAGLRPDQGIQTNRSGELPLLAYDDSQTTQTHRVVRDIEQLLNDGVPAESIVVLARIKALLDPVEKRLLANGISTTRVGKSRDRKHVLRVLKLVHIVEQCEKRGKTPRMERLQRALPDVTDVDAKLWKAELSALKKVSRSPSLEGRYKQCAKIYLRLLGGVRKCPDLRADVNRWETLCRDHSSARAMRDAVRQMRLHAVVTGSIHSAKGGQWDHVFIVGVTDGLLPFYKARNDERAMAEERNLLYVAVTRARDRVRLYHAPSHHAGSRQRFEDVSHFLAEPRVRENLAMQ